MRKLLLVVLMLAVASTAMARDLTLKTDIPNPTADRFEGDCVVGNINFEGIIGYYDTWFYGFENYAVPFNAGETSCDCPEGVAVRAIHMLLALDEFANLEVAAAILDADTDGNGCLYPGAEIAVSAAYTFSGMTEFDYYDIEIAIEGPCSTTGDANFMAVYFLNDNDSQIVGLPISDPANTCTNYNDWGSGYVDVVADYGFQGDLLMWADLICCSAPVATEANTLDGIKSLYR